MNSTEGPDANANDARGGDRRKGDRRRSDRRAPVPPWRRPWAYVAYGVVGALAVLLLFSLGDDGGEAPAAATISSSSAPPNVDTAAAAGAGAPVQDAYSAADFEALLAEGEAAQGRRVRTQLYCQPIRSVGLRTGSGMMVSASVAEHADGAGRVPAADCQWGTESSAPEVLLIVPPALAERFASMPEVERGFVRRRDVPAEVEWIGRSAALALRDVAVLRAIGGAQR